jgi:formate-dependent nitrite reductase cytochrome c552 subunit
MVARRCERCNKFLKNSDPLICEKCYLEVYGEPRKEKEIVDLNDPDTWGRPLAVIKRGGNENFPKGPVGRPSLGITKKVSVTLPIEEWVKIEEAIELGHASSVSDYLRQMIFSY